MGVYTTVLKAASGIEDRLRAQMVDAVDKRNYSEIADLVSVLEKVHDVISQIKEVDASSEEAPAPAKPVKAPPPKQPARSPGKRGYPKYARDGSNLVKIEWNNGKKIEQRHRVPYDTVSLLASTIVKNGGDMFKKDLLAGATTKDGAKIPLHQLYIVLGWLLSAKAIVKKDRGDYIPKQEKLTAAALQEAFRKLDERKLGNR